MKNKILLLLILMLAFFMRFYNFYNFQYFSGDEEIFHAIEHRIITEKKPILVIPNAQTGGSIGAFFHMIVSPVFFLTRGNPLYVPALGSFLGVITTLAMYFAGNLIAGQKMGLLAAVLYGGSFLVALFDRRLWPLTPDPLLILLGIGATIQIIRKKYRYMLLFAITASFAWQDDPTNAVILAGGVITFIIFRIPSWKKEYSFALLYLIFSVLPLIFFEFRHPGTIFRPFFLHLLARSSQAIQSAPTFNFIVIGENLGRALFLVPSKFAEQYFCYCSNYPKPPLSPIPELLAVLLVAFGVVWIIVHRINPVKSSLIVVLVYLLSFLLGIFSYSLILKYSIYQHYFVIAFAPFLLLSAFTLKIITETKWAVFVWIFLIIFLFSNIFVLLNSKMKYPVFQKINLVNKVSSVVGDSTFSVYGGGLKYMTDGGWTTFFIWKGKNPSRSYLNGGWDFIYRAHSLYTINPDGGEGKKVVNFHDISEKKEGDIIEGDMAATILKNE